MRCPMRTRAEHQRPAKLDRARAVLRSHMPGLTRRRAWIYWTDLLGTSLVAWPAFVTGAAIAGGTLALAAGARLTLSLLLFALATAALYRASAFLHEVSHVRAAMPGFAMAWNALIGVPLLTPSLLYDGVHTTHHDRAIFGTDADPEYVPNVAGGHGKRGAMLVSFALVPAFLFVRWALVTPLSLVHDGVRRFGTEQLSSLAGNPKYRRPAPWGCDRARWWTLELACSAWSIVLALFALTGTVPVLSFAFALALATMVSLLHGMRSFATHRFAGGGAQRTVDEQFLDSVNVTGHPILTELWAPLGLRYHALHHLAPRLPYHALGRAHRLLCASLPEDDAYRSVTFHSLREVVAHVAVAPDDPHPIATEAT